MDAIEESKKNPREEEKASPIVQKTDADKKLWLNVSFLEEADVEELMETLTFYAGETTVYFVKNGKKMLCSQKVSPNKALMAELLAFLPQECIKLT